MDRLPLTAASLARFFHIKGSEVERYYKHHLSDFKTWSQKEYATDWVLLADNLGNGETKVEMLTRSRNMLAQSGDKWGESKKERARILFEQYPQMKEAYSLICKVRAIFKSHITRKEAKEKLHEWYKEVNACTLRE
ncbi:transposase, partial [gut metagenome]